MLHELGESDPSSCIHVEMISILDKLLVDTIGLDTLGTETPRKQLHKLVLKLGGKVGDVPACVLAYNKHLSQVRFGLCMTLEAILISTLLLTDLTVPTKTLKALSLHLVGQILGVPTLKAINMTE